MARRTLLLIASILTAALGTALIWLYVQGSDTRAQATAQLVPALFVTQNLNEGDPVGTAVAVKLVPPDVAASAYTDRSQVQALKLSTDAQAGQLLLRNMLSTSASGGTRFPNTGAMALTFSQPNLVPADLKVEDTVDVYEITAQGAESILENVKVRSIGTVGGAGAAPNPAAANGTGNTAPAAGAGIPLTVVGFDVTPAQAKILYSLLGRNSQPALYLHDPAPAK